MGDCPGWGQHQNAGVQYPAPRVEGGAQCQNSWDQWTLNQRRSMCEICICSFCMCSFVHCHPQFLCLFSCLQPFTAERLPFLSPRFEFHWISGGVQALTLGTGDVPSVTDGVHSFGKTTRCGNSDCVSLRTLWYKRFSEPSDLSTIDTS